MAECRERVGTGTITYQCMLDATHEGPCVAQENARSVTARARWQTERNAAKAARDVLAATQGQPMTFAQNIGEGPGSPVPGSDMQPAEYRKANPDSAAPPGRKPTPAERETAAILADPDTMAAIAEAEADVADGRLVCGHHGTALVTTADGPRCRDCFPESFPPEPDEHEQALPVVNRRTSIQSLVIADIEERTRIGIQRYGTPLQPFNGRDSFRDAYEESLDQTQYLRQMMVERAEMAERLRTLMAEGFVYVPGDEGLMMDLFAWLTG